MGKIKHNVNVKSAGADKKLNLRQLKKYKDYLAAIANAKDEDQIQLMEHMNDDDFKVFCNCIQNVVNDDGLMKGRLSDEHVDELKTIIEPAKKHMKKFINPQLPIKNKKRLLRKKQDGGSVILGSILGSLLPMAVHAIENWIWPKKK